MKKKYSDETEKWISAVRMNNWPYGEMNFHNGVRVLSAIGDNNLQITDKVFGSGHAMWRIVNENPRIRKLGMTAEFEEHRAYWSRKTVDENSPVYSIPIDIALEATAINAKVNRDCHHEEPFTVNSSGMENLNTQDIKLENIAKSSFKLDKTPNKTAKVDIGIITIRQDETRAILDRFEVKESMPGNNRTYGIKKIATSMGQKYTLAFVQCTGQGEGQGQDTARDLIEDLRPTWIIVVGIAGSIPSKEFTLGDVIVANRLHDFTLTAWKTGDRTTYEQEGGNMHPVVLDFLHSLEYFKDQIADWSLPQSINCSRPEITVKKKNIQGDDKWKEDLEESLEFHKEACRTYPIYKISPFATSDGLMRDPAMIQQWLESARHINAVEMEIGGIYRAARRIDREYPIIAIRGISDIVGLKRDDGWLKYACNSAASFAHTIIMSGKLRLDIR